MTTRTDRNAGVIKEFRDNEGKVGGRFEDAPVLLLTTKGARTGMTRVHPMMYLQDGDRVLVFASKGGAPAHPDWYHNLFTNPDVTVEVGTETYAARATVLTGDERDEKYAQQATLYPGFAEYEKKTTRKIPVVALARIQ